MLVIAVLVPLWRLEEGIVRLHTHGSVKRNREGELRSLVFLEPTRSVNRLLIDPNKYITSANACSFRWKAWQDLHNTRDFVDLDVHAVRLLGHHHPKQV